MSEKQTTEIDWHAHGMAWALADAMQPGSEEWTAADLARAYEAGAKQAQQFESKRWKEVLEDRGRIHAESSRIYARLAGAVRAGADDAALSRMLREEVRNRA